MIEVETFFKEMRKLNPKLSVAPSIDEHVDSGDIAEHLAKKFDHLYNSVPSDEQNMDRIRDYIGEYCGQCI